MSFLLLTICNSLTGFLKFYIVLLTLRVYLSWFPNLNVYTQPFYSLSKMTDPYLRVFRGIVPVFIGIDISPLLGFILLTFLIDFLSSLSDGIV